MSFNGLDTATLTIESPAANAVWNNRFAEQLRQSEERYRELFENANDLIFTIDLQGNFTSINKAGERVLGYSVEEALTKNISDILSPEHLARARANMSKKVSGSAPTVYELEIITKNGSKIPVETSTRLIEIDGYPVGIQGISRDITERKSAEAALFESERLRCSVLTGAPIILFAVNREGEFTMSEGRGLEALGLTADMLIGLKVKDLYSEDKDALNNIERAMQGETFSANTNINNVYFDTWYAPHRNADGEIVGVIGVATDISERKRVEERLREREKQFEGILGSLQEVVWSYSPNESRILYVSPAVKSVYGVTATEFYQKPTLWLELAHPEDRAITTKFFNELYAEGTAETEYRILRNGEIRWIHCRARQIKRQINELTSVHLRTDGITTDITERKQLEQQLRHAQKLESVGQLAAGIAHEINTPLQYVGDNTRFLRDAFADLLMTLDWQNELVTACREQHLEPELLARIMETVKRCDVEYLSEEIPQAILQSLDGLECVTKIVQSMNDFTHPGSTEMKSVDLNKSIESTVTVTRNEWKYIADLELDFDTNLPPVLCFASEINQVILNLIINAVHAIQDVVGDSSDRGKIKITTQIDKSGKNAEIRISDTGAGIPEDIRGRIFDPFFTTKEVGKGTGQGLAISHRLIVGKHGGKLTFETEKGCGTTFIISLPLQNAKIMQPEYSVA